ncbi:beta-lactamase-like protein [Trametes gibbosa]|nr:beta-lactamase-like protein [Trametes gibbosa]
MLFTFCASSRPASLSSLRRTQTLGLSRHLKISCVRQGRLMSSKITVTFLGTTSGGGPTETRNCSSLVVDPVGDGVLWMVDCAEGTVRQFAQQPYPGGAARRLRLSQVSKIFITHMHADHTMGLLTVLRNALGIPKPRSAILPDTPHPNSYAPHVEIFGPRGVRRMLRSLWHLTHTHSEHAFVVHELLSIGQSPSVAADVPEGQGADEADVRRESECVGRDIWCDAQGFWRGIIEQPASRHKWGVLLDAGPIEHRDPCIGYIIREVPYVLNATAPLPRKLVILGDTYDPSPLIPLVFADPLLTAALPELNNYLRLDPAEVGRVHVPVSLLVHEATDAYLPPHVDPHERTGRNRTEESVEAKTRERGHSTPAMAGAFARRIGAERLVLNHIGARFPAPAVPAGYGGQERFRTACMQEIERQAAETWVPPRYGNAYPQAAWDFLSVTIPPNRPRGSQETGAPSDPIIVDDASGRDEAGGQMHAMSAEDVSREYGQYDRKRERETSGSRGDGASGHGSDARRAYGSSGGRGRGYGGGRGGGYGSRRGINESKRGRGRGGYGGS